MIRLHSNWLYTAYFTRAGKDRLSVLDVLRQGRKRIYLLNVEALTYLDGIPFSKETRHSLEDWRSETVMAEATFIHELDIRLPILNNIVARFSLRQPLLPTMPNMAFRLCKRWSVTTRRNSNG